MQIALPTPAHASPGQLDPNFGNGGIVVTTAQGAQTANAVAQDANGFTVIAGSAVNKPANAGLSGLHSFLVARYTPSGALDPAFNGTGINASASFGSFDDQAFGVALQPDGSVIAVGTTSSTTGGADHVVAIARYTQSGALDPTFGTGGLVTTDIRPGLTGENDVAGSVAVQSNGDIVVAGTSWTGTTEQTFVARYTPAGALDPSFGSGGIVPSALAAPSVANQLTSVALGPGGTIDVSATGCTAGCATSGETDAAEVISLSSTGALNTSFASGGIATVGTSSNAAALAVESGGQVVVVGSQGYGVTGQKRFVVARFTATGAPDGSFGSAGIVLTSFDANDDEARAVALEPSGIIVVAGFSQPGGSLATTPYAVAVAEYNADGSPYTGFGSNGLSVQAVASGGAQGYSVVAQPDTSIVVAGEFKPLPALGAGLLRLQGETVSIAPRSVVVPQPAQAPVTLSLTVSLAVPSSVNVSVNYQTAGGSAVPGVDYVAQSGTLIFSSGQTAMTINIPILSGANPGPDVSFAVTLSGATNAAILVSQSTVLIAHSGYRLVGADGGIYSFGNSGFFGSMGGHHLNSPVVGIATVPGGTGYWLVGADGGIYAFGSAGFFGSMGGHHLNSPIVGIAPTPDGQGYWLVGSDGGIYAFGDAGFYGSMGGHPLNSPIVGMTSSPTGHGYWFVGADGGIFAFGDAGFFGSMGGRPLNSPIVGMTSSPTGHGYWFVGADGGIYAFGDAGFFGSMGGHHLNSAIVGMAASPAGQGYWFVGADGGIYAFGNASFYGSMGGLHLNSPIVGMEAN